MEMKNYARDVGYLTHSLTVTTGVTLYKYTLRDIGAVELQISNYASLIKML